MLPPADGWLQHVGAASSGNLSAIWVGVCAAKPANGWGQGVAPPPLLLPPQAAGACAACAGAEQPPAGAGDACCTATATGGGAMCGGCSGGGAPPPMLPPAGCGGGTPSPMLLPPQATGALLGAQLALLLSPPTAGADNNNSPSMFARTRKLNFGFLFRAC